ncbi:hypothetical protein B6S12_00345 [Helicobacter valdiviensis]|uniref:Hemerythrin-like domain-containing protein n=1 Tax=Helicobacter valdiviensis TaxID=1458358 RepID=A0A2W6N053_9HELI|nr:hemerythrin family protein [Helicobacter valdiviensis]PZT49078.1 hypothetical protein B6S12_00345 [Helicobacter valdiviensis]
MLPVWTKELSVHNDAIDEQHKKLFEIAGKAYALTNKQVTKEEIIVILRELLSYTQEHFKDEEAYMESIFYPNLEKHREKHKGIIKDMTSAVMQIKNINDLKEKLAVIAKKWLLEHILKEDMQIEKFRRNTCQIAIPEVSYEEVQEEQKIKYVCSCPNKVHNVPLKIHDRIQNEGANFNCKVCKEPIKLLGE